MKINKVKWEEQFKIRLAKAEESMDIHDIIKILVVRKILRNNKNKFWLRIYTEYNIEESNLIPDIYVENLKEGSIICYEIQKNLGNDYIKNKTEQYNKLEIYPFKTIDLIVIPLKLCPDKISEINKFLDTYIV